MRDSMPKGWEEDVPQGVNGAMMWGHYILYIRCKSEKRAGWIYDDVLTDE